MINAFKRAMSNNSTFDPHTEPHNDITSGQVSFLIIWLVSAVMVCMRGFRSEHGSDHSKSKCDDVEKALLKSGYKESETPIQNGEQVHAHNQKAEKTVSIARGSPSFDDFLYNLVIFGSILAYFFLCDYRKVHFI